ncbi:hypothetical protein C8R31_101792 [Nitrosospira sp. Nsp2]|nr:hypothetical protein C8R31_101792 [Nitrosospira sp. Nsp2]
MRNIKRLGRRIYRCLVPVIPMNMGDNYCINIKDLVYGNRQIDQMSTPTAGNGLAPILLRLFH